MDDRYSGNTREMRERSINPDVDDNELDIGQYVWLLLEGWWLIAISVAIAVVISVSYALLSTPIYQVDAMLQVEVKKGSVADITDMSSLVSPTSSTNTEIEIIRSRFILGKVVKALNLDVSVHPYLLPVIGPAAYRYNVDMSNIPFLGDLEQYARGGEFAKVDRLDVDDGWLGKPLVLIAEEANHFHIEDGQGELLFRGEVGKTASGKGISLFVSALHARPKVRFSILKTRWQLVAAGLQGGLSIHEKGSNTGILTLTYQSANSELAMKIVEGVAHAYLRQNVERKSEEASRALVFLQGQLPEVRSRMDIAETSLNSYRLQQGSVDIGIETQGILNGC